MQFATPNGLKSAIGTMNARHHIVAIQNAAAQAELFTKMLVDQWSTKTPLEAYNFLSKPDVTVTNQSDKDGQLPKIKGLNETVQQAFGSIDEELSQQVCVRVAAARANVPCSLPDIYLVLPPPGSNHLLTTYDLPPTTYVLPPTSCASCLLPPTTDLLPPQVTASTDKAARAKAALEACEAEAVAQEAERERRSAAVQAARQTAEALRREQRQGDEALARAREALEAWEKENDAKAGERNPQRAAVLQAERLATQPTEIKAAEEAVVAAEAKLAACGSELRAQGQLAQLRSSAEGAAAAASEARDRKARHELAVVHGMVPMVMEREEGQRMLEEQRRAEAEAEAKARQEREAKATAERVAKAAEARARAEAEAEAKAKIERAKTEARAKARERLRGLRDCCCASLAVCQQLLDYDKSLALKVLCCSPLIGCCVSADRKRLYGCVPIAGYDYILPLCLHTCLCPQQGGHPCPNQRGPFFFLKPAGFFLNAGANVFLCCWQRPRPGYNRAERRDGDWPDDDPDDSRTSTTSAASQR